MLYQQVRPTALDKVIGNRTVIQSLKGLVEKKPADRPHAFLLHGPSGCGKTTLARILSSAFGADESSMIEINAANLRGIETVRDISNSADLMPMFGAAKCYILDESHQLTSAAQEALLKIIEDCPKHVYFIFCTTDPAKIVATIRNRCAKYEVMPLRPSELRQVVTNAVADAHIVGDISAELTDAIVKASHGCPRQAIMILEQVIACDTPADALESIEYFATAETGSKDILEMVKLIVSKMSNRWARLAKMYAETKPDPEKVRLTVLGYSKTMLLGLVKDADLLEASRLAELIAIFEKPTYSGGDAALVRMIFESTLLE